MEYVKKFESKLNEARFDGYEFDANFRDFVSDITDEHPKQSFSLMELLDNKSKSGRFFIMFTEEVKDGRSSGFDERSPLKLKGKKFSHGGVTVHIKKIKFENTIEQDSDYNDYIDYIYEVNATVDYKK